MIPTQPPRIAAWFLRHFASSPNNDAVIGDLNERYERGRTRLWYWQQAATAIVVSFLNEVWSHRLLTVRAIVIGWIAFLVSREGLNLTGGLLIALGIWSRQWRHEWIWMPVQIPQIALSGILTGWLVARLHRRSSKAMVLAYTVYFAGFQIVRIAPDLLRGNGAPFYILIYVICFIVITPLTILIGGGVFSTPRNNGDVASGRAAVG